PHSSTLSRHAALPILRRGAFEQPAQARTLRCNSGSSACDARAMTPPTAAIYLHPHRRRPSPGPKRTERNGRIHHEGKDLVPLARSEEHTSELQSRENL